MNDLRLTYDGTEQTLEAWGFQQRPLLTYKSRAAGVFKVTLAGKDPAAADAIPWGGLIVLKDYTADPDSPVTIFVGKRRIVLRQAIKMRNVEMQFLDPWDSLERTTYKQQWNLNGTTSYSSRVYLFQKITVGDPTTPWTYWSTSEQIADIIDFAHTVCGVPIQAGTIDPIMIQPIAYRRGISCAEAIRVCLQSVPDAITYFDYSTTPPTLHIRQRQNCTPVTLPYGNGNDGTGTYHVTSEITSREDLQSSAVVFDYQETDVSDSITYTAFGTDAYPIGATGNTEDAINMSIDLRGSTRHVDRGQITSVTFDETTTAFWKAKKPDLADAAISDLTITGAAVTAPDGSDIDSDTYPYEFTNGVLASWMVDGDGNPIKIIEAQVECTASYSKTDPATGALTHQVASHKMTTKIKLTNSPPGTQNYQALASASNAEQAPLALAYQFWCSVNNVQLNIVDGVITPPESTPDISAPSHLQWEGEHTIVSQVVSNYYDCHNVLNLDDSDGGNSSWAEMAAQIYEVEFDFNWGKTSVRFGPHKHLSAQEFFEQAVLWTTRAAFENPNVRSTGQDSAGGGTQIGPDTRLQDTCASDVPGEAQKSLVGPATAGKAWMNSHDAGTNTDIYDTMPAWIVQQLNTSDGSQVSGSDSFQVKLSDGPGTGIVVALRKVSYKNGSCAAVHRWVVCSDEIIGS